MQKVALKLKKLDGIELFGRDGGWSTDFISKKLNSIDIVEILDTYEKILKKKYPKSNIYIDNTYEFIKKHNKKYDIILSDNPASRHGNYFQHFALFPNITSLMKDKSIIILNVIHNYSNINYNPNKEEKYNALKKFYNVNNISISLEEMIETYKKLFKEKNFNIYNYFEVPRSDVYYLILFCEKIK